MQTLAIRPLVAALVVLGAAIAPAHAQKQQPPAPGTPRDFRLPAKRSFTLANGMEVDMVPFGTVPKATLRLVVRTGNVHEAADEVWLADVTADLMREGTTRRSAAELANAFASMGGTLGINVTPDLTNIRTEVLAEQAPAAVRLLAEVARQPALPASELARIKANRIRQLAINRSSPQAQASEKFAAMMYGDHPYGRMFPTEAMLEGYTIDDVQRFYREHFGAGWSKLYVAGVFDAAAMEQAIRAAFEGWERGTAPAPVPPPRMATQRQLTVLDREDAPQSTIYMGVPVITPEHGDWIALDVADALLGGAFGSRITRNIREDKGYTYSPYSTVSAHPGAAYWAEVADVTTNVTGASLREIFGEIERLQRDAPPADELRGIQNNLAGIFTVQNASRSGVIGQLAFVDLYGLGDDYLTNYVRNVLAIAPADVQRIAQTYLRPDRMTMVIVGDRDVIDSQVAPYGTVVP